jgi:uncharacterized protein YecA (UPF0149 family)
MEWKMEGMISGAMRFEGQRAFEQLLREVNCPKSIHEVYFFLRGLITGTHVSMPSTWFGWLFDGQEPVYDSMEQAQRFMGNIMGLWNLISDAQHDDKPLPDIREEFPFTAEGIKDRVRMINQKSLAFIKGLDFADTDPREMTPDGREALKNLAESDALCSMYLELPEEQTPNLKTLRKSQELLGKVEQIIEDCIQRIDLGLVEARKAAVPRPAAPLRRERGTDPKVPRNAPCPCGSGKKYKKCCWLKLH